MIHVELSKPQLPLDSPGTHSDIEYSSSLGGTVFNRGEITEHVVGDSPCSFLLVHSNEIFSSLMVEALCWLRTRSHLVRRLRDLCADLIIVCDKVDENS
jgi:hypothetical protein